MLKKCIAKEPHVEVNGVPTNEEDGANIGKAL